ncbi:glycosyltransferase [Evansella sp. AB-P1]|uniref:MGDG synthase family glycosyltransferase n=1 Tax=Evansella sp. AB-P1 TaxID=3037653 RepID=UPI00241FF7C2|nr:glycosyltransferase [Evansella sp. AB-P1]MDG5789519.1 glycosyltransferase [Evansella sp. AB-P1]
MPKRMVIFTVSIGEGHHQVSRSLKEEWKARGYEAEIIDIFSFMDETKASKMKNSYFKSIHHYPKVWDWTYSITNCGLTSYVVRPFLSNWWNDLIQYCCQSNIDIYVATHPIATQIGILIKMKSHRPVKLFAVLTDFSTHHLSISKWVDATFVAEKRELVKLKKRYSNVVFYSFGIPLRKLWDKRVNKSILRKKLKLPLDKTIVVISGGGEGVISKEKIKIILENDEVSSHVNWFLGKKVSDLPEPVQLQNGSTIQYFPFCDNYHEYVKAADLFISKPGGVSMAEAIKWHIPTGLLSPLPGQERINQKVLLSYPNITLLDESVKLSTVIGKLQEGLEQNPIHEHSRVRVIDKIVAHSMLLKGSGEADTSRLPVDRELIKWNTSNKSNNFRKRERSGISW